MRAGSYLACPATLVGRGAVGKFLDERKAPLRARISALNLAASLWSSLADLFLLAFESVKLEGVL
jgi:hypothetical protein